MEVGRYGRTFHILAGDADRQWLECYYFDRRIRPLGRVRTIIPAGPNHPDMLLYAVIAFFPEFFRACPSLTEARSFLEDARKIDFDTGFNVLLCWDKLREEAREHFGSLAIYKANFVLIQP